MGNKKEKNENLFPVIEGNVYYFDLNKVFEFINNRSEKAEKEKEVVDSYDTSEISGEIKLSSKIIRETTTPNSSQYGNIKYDLIKIFIIQLITYSDKSVVTDGKSEFELPITNVELMPLGTRIAFNTMVEEGLLIKKENKQ